MSITRRKLAQSTEQETHDKVLGNKLESGNRFLRRGETRSARKKTSRSRNENQQQLNPHLTSTRSPGIDPEPHCWEVSALATGHPCSDLLYFAGEETMSRANEIQLITLLGSQLCFTNKTNSAVVKVANCYIVS